LTASRCFCYSFSFLWKAKLEKYQVKTRSWQT
jgi:hypothetical protein